jgi:hypothetical protein
MLVLESNEYSLPPPPFPEDTAAAHRLKLIFGFYSNFEIYIEQETKKEKRQDSSATCGTCVHTFHLGEVGLNVITYLVLGFQCFYRGTLCFETPNSKFQTSINIQQVYVARREGKKWWQHKRQQWGRRIHRDLSRPGDHFNQKLVWMGAEFGSEYSYNRQAIQQTLRNCRKGKNGNVFVEGGPPAHCAFLVANQNG